MAPKRIYSSQNALMVDQIRNVLEAEGIACTVEKRHLASAAGQIPPIETWPEVWVLDDDCYARAQALVEEALGEGSKSAEPWRCERCGEQIDGQFSECWKCSSMPNEDVEPLPEGDVYGRIGERITHPSTSSVSWVVWVLMFLGVLYILGSYAGIP